ncbi:nucleotidyltransferase domain-containing protein [Alginatibacterium sediminis]|uniref:Nucleotidyltransferase domain-containing protein n=1 Tax=Alginatibacterium sediminis TaxID=2164068 RepID=A0A420E675_9ALTE|nr:nucleotidyltransferase domain-containing protein [Alginatibacterium sediminis]RKF13157.1 nucleotidyltransferase domain-containing protein [Alginatibacterium sediminis]
MNNFEIRTGLKDRHHRQLIQILTQTKHLDGALLFGSRAIGTYKDSSDIDIALEGNDLGINDLASVIDQLDQTTIPYKVDVLIKHQIENPDLIDHIEKHGIRLL